MSKKSPADYGFDLEQLIFDLFIAEKRVKSGYPLTRKLLEEKSTDELVDTVLALTSLLVAERRKRKVQ